MNKEQFIELCKNDPEEVFKLFCIVGKTIAMLQSEVVALNKQVNSLKAEVKELKARLEKTAKTATTRLLQVSSSNQKARVKKAGRKQAAKKATQATA